MNKHEIRKLLVAAGEQSRAIITRSFTRVGFSPLHIDFLKSFIFFPGCFARSFAARAHALKLHSLFRTHKRSTCSKSILYSAT